MRKLAHWLLIFILLTSALLAFYGVLTSKQCGLITAMACLALVLLIEKNPGEWRLLSPEKERIRLSKHPRVFRYLKENPPDEMPSAAWQALRNPPWPVYVALIAPVPAVCILIPLSIKLKNAAGGASPAGSYAIGMLWFVVIFGFAALRSAPIRRRRRLCERAEAANYELCLECGYELQGLPEIHQCPECGADYDKVKVRAVWQEWCKD
jgi:hypothetical protein